jgi:alanine-glyoxylate transaminase/serine-glyoxylate transaminase/serine-pyruvate transaminase
MAQNSARQAGRHFLQIPGPSPVPDRILRAMDTPVIDHRGPEFAKLAKRALEGIKTIFKTTNPVVIYTATGTGAWEGALVNTLSPGDRVLMVETGQFATLWKKMAERIGPEARVHRLRLAPGRRSRRPSKPSSARTRARRSRRSAFCTTRPRPAR